jgi:hypothetical protein
MTIYYYYRYLHICLLAIFEVPHPGHVSHLSHLSHVSQAGGRMNPNEQRLIALIRLAEDLAVHFADGHISILRFSTGWKIILGTPEMTIEMDSDFKITGGGYADVQKRPHFESLEAALEEFTRPTVRGGDRDSIVRPSDNGGEGARQ